MKRLKHIPFLVALTYIISCQPASTQQRGIQQIVIKNVNVIPMTTAVVVRDQTVIIRDGRIYKISSEENKRYDNSATVIDGKGKYLIPGIAEMHAHIPQSGSDKVDETLLLYVANGITTIRGMLGHPEHLQLRADVISDNVLGPRIFTSSPSLNGNSVPTKKMADTLVRRYKKEGYDFLKIHPGIKLDVFNALVATANDVGIGYSGHVPYEVGIRNALSSHYGSVDHVDGFVEGLVPSDKKLSAEQNGFFGLNSARLVDESQLDGLVQMTVDNRVWVVPTQSLFERWASPDDPEVLASEPEMKYIEKATVENWTKNKQRILAGDDFTKEGYEIFITLRRKIIKSLNDKGFGLLLGSDAPQVFNVPGFSIHHEMEGMIRAGLTPYDVLRMGTTNVARFFGKEGEFGELLEGSIADMVLLNGNPLEDIANMKNIEGVMLRGQWLGKEFLEGELDKISAKYSN